MGVKQIIKNSTSLGWLYEIIYNQYYHIKRTSVRRLKYKLRIKYVIKILKNRKRSLSSLYGVDTEGYIHKEDLGVTGVHIHDSLQYEKSNEELLVRLLSMNNLQYQNRVFVDLGSGKGLVLMFAARLPFVKIIGLEFSEKLNSIANANIVKFGNLCADIRCHDITSICGDAADFHLPDEPVVVYMYNPFGEHVMKKVIKNIEERIRRVPHHPLTVIYLVPRQRHVLDGCPLLKNISDDFFLGEKDPRMAELFCVWENLSPASG